MEKKKFLVLDVETANDVNCPLVYDLGFAVCDKYGKIYEKQSMLIYEVYRGERELMNSCYYANKIPEYEEQIKRGETKIVRFFTAWKIIRDTMKKYNIDTIAAYNCNFDRNALNNTIRYLTKSEYRWFFPYNTKYMCIWHMACQVIYTQKTFQKWAKKNSFVSASGNIQTSAEIGHRYYTGNTNFQEEHKGLQDVIIECGIMAKCFAQHKSMKRGINRLCWKIPQKVTAQVTFFFLKK